MYLYPLNTCYKLQVYILFFFSGSLISHLFVLRTAFKIQLPQIVKPKKKKLKQSSWFLPGLHKQEFRWCHFGWTGFTNTDVCTWCVEASPDALPQNNIQELQSHLSKLSPPKSVLFVDYTVFCEWFDKNICNYSSCENTLKVTKKIFMQLWAFPEHIFWNNKHVALLPVFNIMWTVQILHYFNTKMCWGGNIVQIRMGIKCES